MNLEGSIRLVLDWSPVRSASVRVESSRVFATQQLLQGKTADQAVALVPLLYGVCAQAQSAAACAALASARGIERDSHERRARDLAVAAETVQECLTRLLVDWPLLEGAEPETAEIASVRALLRSAFVGRAAVAPIVSEDLGGAVERYVAGRIFGAPSGEWRRAVGHDGPHRWMAQAATLPALLLSRLAPEDWGGDEAALLPALDDTALPEDVARRALADDDFQRRPEWRGVPRETGPLARNADWAPLAATRIARGDGIGSRMLARLADLAATLERLNALCDGEPVESRLRAARLDERTGWSAVETARGMLVHVVQLDAQERIARYRIVAPTEWNFHPDGVVVRGLAGRSWRSARDAKRGAHRLAHALDPCVALEVEVMEHA